MIDPTPTFRDASSPANQPAMSHACVRCSDRKVKCDKKQPCGPCARRNTECIFRALGPPRRRTRRSREDILIERLKLYETILQEKGVDPTTLTGSRTPSEAPTRSSTRDGFLGRDSTPSQTPYPPISEPEGTLSRPQLLHVHGKSKFLNNGLWTRLIEEFDEPGDVLQGSSSETSSETEDAAADVADMDEFDGDVVLDVYSTPGTSTRRPPHPPADQILELWQVFVENVDPTVKIVHVPTLQKAVHEASRNPERISRDLEALLFAVYSVAVLSLDDQDCERRFGQPRKTLLSRYIRATKLALSRARLLGSASLVVFQSFLIHLLCARAAAYDSRTLWTLAGIATRIAKGMGLHYDGQFLGLAPFETEVRRRVWFQVQMLNHRIADLGGSGKFEEVAIDDKTPKRPANVNDADLYPGMPSPPGVPSQGVTDMVFVAMRSEVRSFWVDSVARRRGQQQNKQSGVDAESLFWDIGGIAEKEQSADELERLLEAKYMRYCDISQPIQLLAALLVRAVVTTMRFMAHHPRRWRREASDQNVQPGANERRYVWELCVKLLRQHNTAKSSPQLRRFSWHMALFFQWHPLIHLLDSLRATPLMPEAAETWQLVEETFDNFEDVLMPTADVKEPVYVAIGNLCLKAYRARESALVSTSKPPEPSFITKLRASQSPTHSGGGRQESKSAASQATDPSSDMIVDTNHLNSPSPSRTLVKPSDQQNRIMDNMMDVGALQTSGHGVSHTNIPWQIDDDQNGPADDSINSRLLMDADSDFFSMPTTATDGDTLEATMDWAQWDALFGNPDTVPSLFAAPGLN